MSLESDTAIATVAVAVRDTLFEYGVDVESIFDRANIDLAVLEGPLNRVAFDALNMLWDLGALESGDEAFGLRVSRHLTLNTFYTLGITALASRNAAQATQIVSDYIGLISTGISLRFRFSNGAWSAELDSKAHLDELNKNPGKLSKKATKNIIKNADALNATLKNVGKKPKKKKYLKVSQEIQSLSKMLKKSS